MTMVEIIEVVVPASPQVIQIVVPQPIAAVEIALPGLQGPAGQAGLQGPQGIPGPAADTSAIALDGGNF